MPTGPIMNLFAITLASLSALAYAIPQGYIPSCAAGTNPFCCLTLTNPGLDGAGLIGEGCREYDAIPDVKECFTVIACCGPGLLNLENTNCTRAL